MSNTNTNVLPKLLAQGLLALRENTVMPRLVNTDYSALAAQKGNIINVPIPSSITARDVTPAVTFATNVDYSPTTAAVTLDFWKEAPFQMSDNDVVSAMSGIVPMQASEAVKSLANAIDSYIIGKHVGLYSGAGTAGTTPFATNISAAGSARKLLNKQLAPMDGRSAVLDPDGESNLLQITNVLQFDQRGDAGGIVNGTIGRKLGFDWYMDQNLTTYTPGTGWVTGYTASTVSAAVGDTTMQITNTTASGTVKVGDIFSLDASTLGQQYVVTAAATASATVPFAVSFYPALVSGVNTGGTLTVVGTAYIPNLAFHRGCFAWASRPLGGASMGGGGSMFQSIADPISGVALRLELARQYKQWTWSYDVLGGANVVRRELGTKIFG